MITEFAYPILYGLALLSTFYTVFNGNILPHFFATVVWAVVMAVGVVIVAPWYMFFFSIFCVLFHTYILVTEA